MEYKNIYNSSLKNPEEFWLKACNLAFWKKFPTKALDNSTPPYYNWFNDGITNVCYNAIDRHVLEGRGESIALIYDSPVTGTNKKISYNQLLKDVTKLSYSLSKKGIKKGDRVVIYMPMIPEAIVSMLACSRIGAIHCVVFGGFAAKELAVRIDDAKPKAIIAASCGIEPNRIVKYKPLLDESLNIAKHKPDFNLVFQRKECEADLNKNIDIEWHDFQINSGEQDCVFMNGNEPLYLLYTSGTTGQPKGVIRPSAGHMVSLLWSMKYFYDISKNDVFWAASDVGWVVGHSYICYAPLLNGSTSVVFEGKPVGTPDASTFWRVISDYKVKSLFTAPTAFRAIKRDDPEGKYIEKFDLSCLSSLFLAGERADPDTIKWAQRKLKVPVIDHWWQTETGSPMVGNPIGIEKLPIKIGSPTLPLPGYDLRVLDTEGNSVKANELGSIVIKLPLPPGSLPTLWNNDERFLKSYLSKFPGYYETGDAGIVDEDGYVYIMSRTDDVINVAGHRLSTGAMEEILSYHEDVAESAVVGVDDDLKGQIPIGFVCLNKGVKKSHDSIIKEIISLVREKIGPVAVFKIALIVERLPKTRSGKILRGTISKIANGETFATPSTIDDPKILEELSDLLKNIGYPKEKS